MYKTNKKSKRWIKLGNNNNLPAVQEKLSWAQLAGKNVETVAKIKRKSRFSSGVNINFKVKISDLEKVYPDIYTSVVNFKDSNIKITKESNIKSSPVNIKVDIKAKKGIFDLIYPDILTMLINFMDINSYLNFINASGSSLNKMSLLNGPYIKYLKTYYPDQYENLIENKVMILKKHRKLDSNSSYLIYEIHQILYSKHYEDLDENIYDVYEDEYKDTF